jgi:hypothetical protein
MSDDNKPDENADVPTDENEREVQRSRRDFLRSLGKWSAVLIGAAVGGSLLDAPDAAAWVNGGRAWVNGRGGYGGGSWVNRSGGGGGAWVNRSGGYGGGSWVNRSGGYGGGSWVNRRGY